MTDPFRTVPDKDHFSFFKRGEVDCKRVVEALKLKTEEVAEAAGVPAASVRYDDKTPQELRGRATEWAALMNLVAQRFHGDVKKASLWFFVSNPALDDLSPREVIRLGRYKKLLKLVLHPVNENAQ